MSISRSASYALGACAAGLVIAGCVKSQSVPGVPEAPALANRAVVADRGSGVVWPALSCSKAPCAFENVRASRGERPAAETPMVANPNDGNQLLAAAIDWNCGYAINGYIPKDTAMFASSDGGKTWNRHCLALAPNATFTSEDPSVAYDLKGTAYASGPEGFAYGSGYTEEDTVTKSTDNGRTWSAPVVVPTIHPNTYADRMWLEADTSPSSPRKNDLYVSEVEYYGASQLDSVMTVSHSTDGGSTWTTVPVGPAYSGATFTSGGNAVVGKDGTVYITALVCSGPSSGASCGGTVQTNYLFRSNDGGKTWSSGTVIDKPTIAPEPCHCSPYGQLPGTKAIVAELPMIAIDNSNGPRAGTLYVADASWVHNSFLQVRLISSKDGGKTWSKPRLLAPKSDTHDQFFPWVSVNPRGTIGVTWLDRRNDPKNLLYEEFGAYSTDGIHFPNYQIAAKPSDPRKGWPKSQGYNFIGDFTGGVWVGKKLYAAWPDTNNPTHHVQDVIGGLQTP